MIYLLYGVLGAGKTYYLIYNLITKFCIKLGVRQYQVKGGMFAVTNISGIKVQGILPFDNEVLRGCLNYFSSTTYLSNEKIVLDKKELHELQDKALHYLELDEGRRVTRTLRRKCLVWAYFTLKVQKSLYFNPEDPEKLLPVCHFLDEFHNLFRDTDRNIPDATLQYFTEMRHLGHVFYLVTQHYSFIPTFFIRICEQVCSTRPQSQSVRGEFSYKWHFPRSTEAQKTEQLPKIQEIFGLYTSEEVGRAEVPRNEKLRSLIKRVLILGALTSIALGYTFYQFKANFAEMTPETPERVEPTAVPAGSPSASLPASDSSSSSSDSSPDLSSSSTGGGSPSSPEQSDSEPLPDDPFSAYIREGGENACMVRVFCWNGRCYLGKLSFQMCNGAYPVYNVGLDYYTVLTKEEKGNLEGEQPGEDSSVCYPLPRRKIPILACEVVLKNVLPLGQKGFKGLSPAQVLALRKKDLYDKQSNDNHLK